MGLDGEVIYGGEVFTFHTGTNLIFATSTQTGSGSSGSGGPGGAAPPLTDLLADNGLDGLTGALAGGIAQAKVVLANPDCITNLFGGQDAAAFLDKLNAGSLVRIGSKYPSNGNPKKMNYFPSPNTGAITSRAAGTFPGNISAPVITVNSNSFYVTGKLADRSDASKLPYFRGLSQTDIRAAVIIHELAHAMNVIPSDGQLQGGEPNPQSAANQQKVYDDCFKQKKK